MKFKKSLLILLLFYTVAGQVATASDIFQDFNSWPYENDWDTVRTNDGWVAYHSPIKNRDYNFNQTGAVWCYYDTTSYLMTPLLSNGVGTVIFENAYNTKNYPTVVYLQTSTNGVDNWTTQASYTNTAAAEKVWEYSTNTINFYESCYLRVTKTGGDNKCAGIDNFTIKPPPAKVYFGTPYTDPVTPHVREAADVFCTITPSAMASGIAASLVYEISGVYATNAMSETATQNLYRTDSPIPGQILSGITVNYEIIATFSGTNALSPASTSSSYKVQYLPFEADHDPMNVIGDTSATMTIVSNHLWRGIASISNIMTNAEFQFQGLSTNGSTTHTWGDTAPDSTALVAYGTAGLSESAFSVDSMPADDYLFQFNESDLSYIVNSADFNDFDDWTGADSIGNHDKDGWVIRDGWVTDDTDRRRGTMSCYLSTNGSSYVRTPEIEGGIGQISFWVRHWETNAAPTTECMVQTSSDGGTNSSEWTTISTIQVNFSDFNRFVIPHNNRYDRYVRILGSTGTPARLAIDEFMVTGAGAGVVMTNLTHTPAEPALDDSVSVSVNIDSCRGASVSGLVLHWRSGTDGGYTDINMHQDTGNSWVSDTDIPAGSGGDGDGLGAGTVQYYVDAIFSGYQSDLGSPTPVPEGGSLEPASYLIESASMTYSNVVHTPVNPEINSSFSVEADIIPAGEAINASAELFYRIGSSGDFTEIDMLNSGNHYITESDIPTSSHPGTPVYYYIKTLFQGPSANSPTNYPAGGAADPISVISHTATPESDYTNIVVEGDFNGGLILVRDKEWSGIITNSLSTGPAFHFEGSGSNTVSWGDDSVTAGTLPLFGTSVDGENDITLSGTYTNNMIFYFNETNLRYSANGCYLEDFSSFSLADPPASATNANGWILHSATVFDTNGAFQGQSCGLGGPNAGSLSYLRSPVFDGGIGNISFQYRNLDENGTLSGTLELQIRQNGGDWETLESITNILSPDYIFYESGYGNQQDDIEIQLTWNESDNPDYAEIAIDNFTVEEPGAYTLFTNLTHSPTNPTIADEVTIDVDINPINHATNITATTWFRIGTNGSFTAVNMVNTSGNHFRTVPNIPHSEPGIIQYYVESAFTTPLENNTIYAYEPAGGENDPASYSNSDAYAAATYFEASEGWVRSIGAGLSQTNNNWIAHHAELRDAAHAFGNPEVAWLENDGSTTTNTSDSYVRTPFLSHGAGTIRFKTKNLNFDEDENEADLLIEKSSDGTNWTTIATVTSDDSDNWTEHTVNLQIETPIYLRIYKETKTALNSRLGIDDVEVSYPIAKVQISNEDFDPLYPADSERVKISCDINSVGIFAPAIDITARVYYKKSTDSTYTEAPVEMSRSGSHFITDPGIPAQDAGCTVDYYIESTFKGYSCIISNSPAFSPSNAPASCYSYDIRAHESDFGNITIRTDSGDVDMKQVSDQNWLGILNFNSPTNDICISVIGQDYYDGNNLIPGDALTWGHDAQDRTNMPYVGTMVLGDTNLMMNGEISGQYILDFNEETGEYTLRRGVYQTFNRWSADYYLFESGRGSTDPTGFDENFGDTNKWPVTVFPYIYENFENSNWIANTNYPPLPTDFGDTTPTNIYTYLGKNPSLIIQQPVGKAMMIGNTGYIRLHNLIPNEGTEMLSFDIRCVNDDLAPALYDASAWTNIVVEATIKATDIPSDGYAHISVIGHFTDINNYYELRMVQYGNNSIKLEIWKNLAGTLTKLRESSSFDGKITRDNNKLSLFMFVDGTYVKLRGYLNDVQKISSFTDSSAITAAGDIGLSGMDADIAVNNVIIYELNSDDYDDKTNVYEEAFSSGSSGWNTSTYPWTVSGGSFLRPGYTDIDISFSIDYLIEGESTWQTSGSYTGYNNTACIHIDHEIKRPEDMSVRVKQNNTTGYGYIIVDNMKTGDWHGSDFSQTNGWLAAQVTIADTNALNMRTSQAYTNLMQYIRSPLLPNGAAGIEFDYRTSTTTSNELIFSIDYTLNGSLGDWQTGIIITNSPEEMTGFSWALPDGSGSNDYQMYIRIQNQSSDWDSGMLIDNIQITEPIPLDDNAWRVYNALITPEQASRLLPETENIKGAYLNNSYTNDTGGEDLSASLPYIETSMMPDGIGEVSFWYRAWDTNTGRIDILASDDRNLAESQWHLLATINNITNLTFSQYSEDFYETDYQFLRLRVPSNIQGMGRVCIDNLMVAQPFGASVYLRNMTLIPELPLYDDSVYLQAEVYNTFMNPSNIFLRAIFQTGSGDWGQYNNHQERTMALISTVGNVRTYRSKLPFRAGGHPADTVVQYHVQADFDGFFSEKSSPARYKEFTNPSWYWPVDLNSNQTDKTPYYVVFSCLPGQVWINELNVGDDYSYPDPSPTQYVELCGISDVDIGNWKIKLYDIDDNAVVTTNASYTVPDSTSLPHDTTNNFGFYQLGSTNTININLTLTNNMPMPAGGIQLIRSMGAVEHSICYDTDGYINTSVTNNPTYRFVYIGTDDDYKDTSLYSTGSGSNLTDFASSWTNTPSKYSPGSINYNQTLVEWDSDTNAPAYSGSLEIGSFSITDTTVTFVVNAETNDVTMTPWYTTNLITGPWTQGINAGQTLISGSVYNVWCDLATNKPGCFYKVTVP